MSALLALLMLAAPPASPAPQHGGDDQARAFQARREGRSLPLREIERRVVPTVPRGQYLGADYDDAAAVYTLKFLRDGQVIWVQVDGGTGQVVGRSAR